MTVMEQDINIFDQYEHLENRLTHALGVTLQHSSSFRDAFIKKFSAFQLKKNPRIKLQLANDNRADKKDEITGIPDLTIIDDMGSAIVIESKVGAKLHDSQLRGHQNRARHNGLKIHSALAITGRSDDDAKIKNWIKQVRLEPYWRHVTWRQVFHLAAQHSDDLFVKQLQEYMNIIADQLNEKNMDPNVKIVDFTGIPFKTFEDFDFRVAKRILRSLMDGLREDKAFLAALGFKNSQTPRMRKKIKSGLRIWDYLSPVEQDGDHKGAPHFTVKIT